MRLVGLPFSFRLASKQSSYLITMMRIIIIIIMPAAVASYLEIRFWFAVCEGEKSFNFNARRVQKTIEEDGE